MRCSSADAELSDCHVFLIYDNLQVQEVTQKKSKKKLLPFFCFCFPAYKDGIQFWINFFRTSLNDENKNSRRKVKDEQSEDRKCLQPRDSQMKSRDACCLVKLICL